MCKLDKSLRADCEKIPGASKHQIGKRIVAQYLSRLNVRRITNDNVEPTIAHDPIEFRKPVERLVTPTPLVVGFRLTEIHPVCTRQIAIQCIRQFFESNTQLLLSHSEVAGIH